MKTFEQVYQAWMDENIADAKKYVKELNKKERSSHLKAASTIKTKSLAAIKNNITGSFEGELDIRLTV
jgi:hypothetical protein